jgi:hypothetical protein
LEVKFLSGVRPRDLLARAARVLMAELREWAEDTARERLRYSIRELSQDVWLRAERVDPPCDREIKRLFGLEGGETDAKRHRRNEG